jgi:hypothetical protein
MWNCHTEKNWTMQETELALLGNWIWNHTDCSAFRGGRGGSFEIEILEDHTLNFKTNDTGETIAWMLQEKANSVLYYL